MDIPPTSRPEGCMSEGKLTPDNDLWMQDGNVVLICDTVDYRVHQSILSRHSKVFKDMFAVGTPEGEETFDNAVVIRLQDAPEIFKDVLRSLYNIRYPSFGTNLSLEWLRKLLLISNKYLFEELRNHIIAHLQILFPRAREDLTSAQNEQVTPDDFSGMLGVQINLESHVPAILPAASFFAAHYSVTEILQNFEGPNRDV